MISSLLHRSFPLELTVKVLEDLDVRALLNCTEVCRALRALIKETTVLQYHILLVRAGVHDAPPGSFTTADRLAKLKEYSRAWTHLLWTDHTEIVPDPEDPAFGILHLQGGIFAQAFDHKLVFHKLPSRLRGISGSRWELRFDYIPMSFAFDTAQDLLVVLDHTPPTDDIPLLHHPHFKLLSAGKKHPLASDSPAATGYIIERFHPEYEGHDLEYNIQIHGDHVGILFDTAGLDRFNHLAVWNWKTGALAFRATSQQIGSFAFLDKSHILVAVRHSPRVKHEASSFAVYELTGASLDDIDDVTGGVPTALLSFLLPPLHTDNIVLAMEMTCNISPSRLPQPSEHFSLSDEKLVAIYYRVQRAPESPDTDDLSFTLFVKLETFVSHLKRTSLANVGELVPWEEWGPGNFRMYQCPAMPPANFVNGLRHIHPYPIPRCEGMLAVAYVWDFHTFRMHAPGVDTIAVPRDRTLVMPEMMDTMVGGFMVGKPDQLPLHVSVIPLPPPLSSFDFVCTLMLSDDTIIALQDNFDMINPIVHFLTF